MFEVEKGKFREWLLHEQRNSLVIRTGVHVAGRSSLVVAFINRIYCQVGGRTYGFYCNLAGVNAMLCETPIQMLNGENIEDELYTVASASKHWLKLEPVIMTREQDCQTEETTANLAILANLYQLLGILKVREQEADQMLRPIYERFQLKLQAYLAENLNSIRRVAKILR